MSTFVSYEQNGKKLSFANWISNLSPQEVPFCSMTGKESIQQTLFQWQTDTLAPVAENAVIEGSAAPSEALSSTTVVNNITQILRKVVQVSDTANTLANYGRGKELQYQMEKKGKEIKRDLEFALLNQGAKVDGDAGTARKTAGYPGLVAALGVADADTGAIVNKDVLVDGTLTEVDLFDITYELYIAGSSANIIMFHPKHATFFSALQERSGAEGNRQRIFENTTKFAVYVSTVVDPLGQEYKLVPNRWMPEESIYFFNPSDWTQMVLRAPSRTKLAKDGSYEKWMIEMEVGLRHRNPFASGILNVVSGVVPVVLTSFTAELDVSSIAAAGTAQASATLPLPAGAAFGALSYVSGTPANATIDGAGVVTGVLAGTSVITITDDATAVTSDVTITVT
jgi:hypothetical protein